MYSANARVFLVCANRAHLLKRSVQSQILNCVYLGFGTCNVHRRKNSPPISNLFTPVQVQPSKDSDKVGEELVGSLQKSDILGVIKTFARNKQVKLIAAENGIDGEEIIINETIYQHGLNSFRKYCLLSESLPADLHVTFFDIINKAGNALDIFPYFLTHVREMYPHLECLDDLKKIGDIQEPANWFPETRKLQRKFYFHCGPTNSGKTFEAVQRFLKVNSGIYCSPLKLLAVEVHQKANQKGTPCDLITGEDVILVNPDGESSPHISCTIEMCPLDKSFDVAVIDEIQMLRDPQRGWAWTRALLGIKANEIYLCGEESAIDIVDSILCTTGEKIEVKHYKRLSELHIDSPLESLDKVQPGDCIVCFNRNDIYSIARTLKALDHSCAIIYGSLPPQTKLVQCEIFNDPNHPCKLIVATDAIGMGLNLNIRRIIFYSLLKVSVNESGEAVMRNISVSQALQIAGRAGRFGSTHKEGFVTTFKNKDLKTLENLLSQKPEKIVQAGLHPSPEQIELFSYYLPKSSLSELIEIFCNLCTLDDSLYFMCDLVDIKALASLIDHVPLPVKIKYVFCCAPVNKKMHFVTVVFIAYAKMYSLNMVVDAKWVRKRINWPLQKPRNYHELGVLESYHEVLDLYLWLGCRFEKYFPDASAIREMQKKIESLIQYGVMSVKILMATENDSEVRKNPNPNVEGGESLEMKCKSAYRGS